MKVKWFQDERGFGFIEYKSNGEVVMYLFTTNNDEYLMAKEEVVELDFVESKSGYIVKEN